MNTVTRWLVGRPSWKDINRAHECRELTWLGAPVKEYPLQPNEANNILNREKAFAEIEDVISYDLPLSQKLDIYVASMKEVWPQRIRHFTRLLHDR